MKFSAVCKHIVPLKREEIIPPGLGRIRDVKDLMDFSDSRLEATSLDLEWGSGVCREVCSVEAAATPISNDKNPQDE